MRMIGPKHEGFDAAVKIETAKGYLEGTLDYLENRNWLLAAGSLRSAMVKLGEAAYDITVQATRSWPGPNTSRGRGHRRNLDRLNRCSYTVRV